MLSVTNLVVEYGVRKSLLKRSRLRAVNEVSFELGAGETFSVIGESGCGKSSLARAVLGLVPAACGDVRFRGASIRAARGRVPRDVRREIQAIFQDPLDSLDPRQTALQSVMEPIEAFEPAWQLQKRREVALQTLEQVSIGPNLAERYPHELSGGQCQRVGLARAIVLKPKLVVCDEPTSALDANVQRQIIELLQAIRMRFGVGLLFVSHNLPIVREISDRVMVMYLGRTMELASGGELHDHPLHPYTQALLAAVPSGHPRAPRTAVRLHGEIPSPLDPPSGCPFRTRCPRATAICAEQMPLLREVAPKHLVACHHWGREQVSSSLDERQELERKFQSPNN